MPTAWDCGGLRGADLFTVREGLIKKILTCVKG